jgi:hypothetical protein
MKLWKFILISLAVTLGALAVDTFHSSKTHSGAPDLVTVTDGATMQSKVQTSHSTHPKGNNCDTHEKLGCCMSQSGVLPQTGISFTKPNSSSWFELISKKIFGRFVKPRLRPPSQFAAYPNSSQ